MSERLTPERMEEVRAALLNGRYFAAGRRVVGALLAELDAVTQERDDLAAAAKRVIDAVEKCDGIQKGSYSGMNFITNRDGTVR